jgi:hypothetical protein
MIFQRWCVIAKFARGGEVILRDYHGKRLALAMAEVARQMNLYPGRHYTIQVERRPIEVEDARDIDSARRSCH